jgi:amidohydrolase
MEVTREDLKTRIVEQISVIESELIELSSVIHGQPELGHQEFFAAEALTSYLRRHGFEVEESAGGLPTAFVARATANPRGAPGGGTKEEGEDQREGTPVVAFLAEYDALPELGHACGHNLIGVASVGAAIALRHALTDYPGRLPGEVRVLGTPAEETSGGKVTLVEKGLFSDVDVAMMFHPSSRNTVLMNSLAIEPLEFVFKGKAAHAAAAPHEGINALDACIGLFNAVNALRQHVRTDVRIHGIISEGGTAPNIVPDRAVARFYVRAATRRYLGDVLRRVGDCARGAAQAAGAELEIRPFEVPNDNMRNNIPLAEAMANNLRLLGVTEIVDPGAPLGSSDIGNVSQVAPAIHPTISIGPKDLVAHTPEFTRAANSPEAHRGMILAAKALAMTGIDVLTDRGLLARIKADFESGE